MTIIEIEGGCVVAVKADAREDGNVLVIDRDTDGADLDRLHADPAGTDGDVFACALPVVFLHEGEARPYRELYRRIIR